MGREKVLDLCSICLIAVLPACLPQPDLNQLYLDAVNDAQNPQPSDVSTDLTPIVGSNRRIVWEDQPGMSRVLVVTWTSYTGYDDKVGQNYTTTRDTWVTAVPEVKRWVARHHVPPWALTLRLEELLGVPPSSGKDRFVEFWVDPNDLFRPSRDPEINDREAALVFPISDQFVTVDPCYVQWFDQTLATIYQGPTPHPWTQLGYTYDWGDPFDHVGLSEFVIRTGATVTIDAVVRNEEYCRWW
jgi:hypothetical protein